MEPNEIDEALLEKIEVKAGWEDALDKFIKEYAHLFIDRQIPIGSGLIAWEINKVHSKLHRIEERLVDILAAMHEGEDEEA